MQKLKFRNSLSSLFETHSKDPYPFLLGESSLGFLDLRGLRIIQNIPLTFESLLKSSSLLASGAELTISIDRSLPVCNNALNFLKNSGLKFAEKKSLKDVACDVVLDCNGGLVNIVDPRLGFVELTGSGKYKYSSIKKPVINVDDSHTKKLETFFGTGESLVRALVELGSVPIKALKNSLVVVFGFGKVGKGIVHELVYHGCHVVLVDSYEKALDLAKNSFGCIDSLHTSNKEKIKEYLKSSLAVVTATGLDGWVSKEYRKEDFANVKILANMGAEDEFGSSFQNHEVLNNKFPANFGLREPTKPMFLDPIFFAHNLAAKLLAEETLPFGLNPLDRSWDLSILNAWHSMYPDFNLSPAFEHLEELIESEIFATL